MILLDTHVVLWAAVAPEKVGADASGNRTSVREGGSTRAATYDGEDRILSLGNVSYAFSSLGQLATKTEGANVTRYQFDAVGILTKVTLSNNQTVEYELDASGRRVGRKVDGVKKAGWLYDGPIRVVAQTDAGGNVTQRYVYGTQGHSPDYAIAGSTTYRLVKDVLGSVRLVVNVASGEVKQRVDYDVWGRVTANSNPAFQPFGFAGGLLDSDTGLTRFGAREYDGEQGRWVTKDPIRFAGGDGSDPILWTLLEASKGEPWKKQKKARSGGRGGYSATNSRPAR